MVALPGTYEADPDDVGGDFTPIPPGEYPFTIVEADYKQNSKQNGYFIYIKAQIDQNAPAEGGRTFEDRFNIDNPNDKAVEISRRQLNALLVAVGKMKIDYTEDLIGLSGVAKLKVDPAKPYMKDGVEHPGSPSNSVQAYKPAGTAAPAQQQSAGAANSNATPPWKRAG